MPKIAFDELPEDARVWIFSAERKLTESERIRLLAEVDAFINRWAAHAVPLTAGRDLVYDQFLFIAVDQRAAGPSGCSVDALVRQMKALEQEIGVELVNHAPVLFRQGQAIARVPREAFAEAGGGRGGRSRHDRLQQHADQRGRRAGGPLGGAGDGLVARAGLLLIARGRRAPSVLT